MAPIYLQATPHMALRFLTHSAVNRRVREARLDQKQALWSSQSARYKIGTSRRREIRVWGALATPNKAFMGLTRLVRDQEAGGSNPLAPTILFNQIPRTPGLFISRL